MRRPLPKLLFLFSVLLLGAAYGIKSYPVITLKEAERRTIEAALKSTGGDKSKAARTLAKAGAKVADVDLGKPFEQFEAMGRRINDYEFSRSLTWERNHHWNLLTEFQRDKLAGLLWSDRGEAQARSTMVSPRPRPLEPDM